MFDKVQYRKNREEGKRGQGELPKPEVKEGKSGQHMVQIGTSLQFVNRKTARGYASGTKKEKPTPQKFDPRETNHERVVRQGKIREYRREQAKLRKLAEQDASDE